MSLGLVALLVSIECTLVAVGSWIKNATEPAEQDLAKKGRDIAMPASPYTSPYASVEAAARAVEEWQQQSAVACAAYELTRIRLNRLVWWRWVWYGH